MSCIGLPNQLVEKPLVISCPFSDLFSLQPKCEGDICPYNQPYVLDPADAAGEPPNSLTHYILMLIDP